MATGGDETEWSGAEAKVLLLGPCELRGAIHTQAIDRKTELIMPGSRVRVSPFQETRLPVVREEVERLITDRSDNDVIDGVRHFVGVWTLPQVFCSRA
jgi:hypothetical protein